MGTPTLLRFSGSGCEVTDEAGSVVATVARRRSGTSFEVHDPGGAPLSAATTSRWGLSNLWRATDAGGRPLLEIRKHTWRSAATVMLAREGELIVEGSLFRRTFLVREGDDVVLDARPGTGSRAQRKELVLQSSGRLTLAEAVTVVQAWLELRRRDETAAAGAVAATVVVSG